MSSACWARLSKLVNATSTWMPSCHIAVAPVAASFLPRVVSSTSAQPVKRLASLQTDWPWTEEDHRVLLLLHEKHIVADADGWVAGGRQSTAHLVRGRCAKQHHCSCAGERRRCRSNRLGVGIIDGSGLLEELPRHNHRGRARSRRS